MDEYKREFVTFFGGKRAIVPLSSEFSNQIFRKDSRKRRGFLLKEDSNIAQLDGAGIIDFFTKQLKPNENSQMIKEYFQKMGYNIYEFVRPSAIKIDKPVIPEEVKKAQNEMTSAKSDPTKYPKVTKLVTYSAHQAKELSTVLSKTLDGIPILQILDVVVSVGLSGIRLVGGIVGVVASYGAGGDTIVELIILALQSSILLGRLGYLGLTTPGDPWLQKIIAIRFDNGPNGVETEMKQIMKQINQQDNASIIKGELCVKLSGVFVNLINIFSTCISAFIPDDAGVVATVIEIAVMLVYTIGSMAAFIVLKKIYNGLVPSFAKRLLQNPKDLEKFLKGTANFIKKSFQQKSLVNRTAFGVLKETLLTVGFGFAILISLAIPGGVFFLVPPLFLAKIGLSMTNAATTIGIGEAQVIMLIELFETQIPTMVELIQRIMPLTYAVSYLLASC